MPALSLSLSVQLIHKLITDSKAHSKSTSQWYPHHLKRLDKIYALQVSSQGQMTQCIVQIEFQLHCHQLVKDCNVQVILTRMSPGFDISCDESRLILHANSGND